MAIYNIENNSNKYLVNIYPNYIIPESLELLNKKVSVKLSNRQHKYINEMVKYLTSGNYFGTEYNNYLNKQKNANNYWISTYYSLNNSDNSFLGTPAQ